MNKKTIKCQIKQFNDPNFGLPFEVDDQTDIDSKALELLGYFIVIQAPEDNTD